MSFDRRLDQILERHRDLSSLMSNCADAADFVRMSKEFAELAPVVACIEELRAAESEAGDLAALMTDPDGDDDVKALAEEEFRELAARVPEIEKKLGVMLLPRDAADEKSAILEVRAGTGGDEAALFAMNLLRMYQRYAERHDWNFNLLHASETAIGGLKEAVAEVAGKGAFSRLKFESGVHRVQRVPETESSGRIHTSAATVAVLPEAEEVDVRIDEKDLRVDTFRSQGAGGQHVNTTDSAVRITHLPSGIVVQCQNDRSQHRNRAEAMRMLQARLYEAELQRREEAAQADQDAKTEIGWGHQIRSYVLHPYRMVKDLRTGVETSNAQAVLDGGLDEFMAAALAQRVIADRHAK